MTKVSGEANGMKQIDGRLARIEDWMQKINDALISMARTEERLGQTITEQVKLATQIAELQKEMGAVKAKMTRFELAKALLGKFFWFCGAVLGIMYAAHPDKAVEIIKLLAHME